MLPSLDQIHEAQNLIYRYMPPTPQYSWPLINERLGFEAWIKHENHTPVGAFKLRGALVYLTWLKQAQPSIAGVVAATRGNFGQGVAMAARFLGLKSVIVVPHVNNLDKNRAIVAQGAELLEHGNDFQESLEFARALATQRGFAIFESFHERLVWGTATYALEFFEGAPPLDRIYVPIGLGSSICGIVAARNALRQPTEIVGVASAACPAIALSFQPAQARRGARAHCESPTAWPAAAQRMALEIIWANVTRIVEVTDEEIAAAMRICYQDTHNIAEGAGAASLAAALKEKSGLNGKRIGIVLTGGNVDRETFVAALNGKSQAERLA